MKHETISPEPAAELIEGYQPVELARRRHDGWTAERQRTFLVALAETGCISEACRHAGITARSAYRLRAHPSGGRFAAAWDQALRYATSRLMTLAYECAIRGSIREQWRDGKLVSETRQPSDKLLMFLLAQFAPWHREETTRWTRLDTMAGHAARDLAPILEELTDSPVPAEELREVDFEAQPPVRGHEPHAAPFDEDEEW